MSESTTVAEQVDNATYLKNIIDYMQSTFVDRDYSIENDWKIIFKHSYMYPNQYPGYTQKKNELLIKKHSTEEILGFQLLPHKFQSMSFLPMLNQHVMSEFRQAQLQNSILKEVVPNQEGITLFKSVDVLLKSVAHSHRRYAKIAVYKVMPGRTKVRFCTDEELNNKINDLPLEHEFDSSSMEYMGDNPLKTNSLVNQLLCSQITLQDVREHSVNGRTIEMLEDAPRQISPVTVVTFVYLRPLVSIRNVGSRKILPATPAFVVGVKMHKANKNGRGEKRKLLPVGCPSPQQLSGLTKSTLPPAYTAVPYTLPYSNLNHNQPYYVYPVQAPPPYNLQMMPRAPPITQNPFVQYIPPPLSTQPVPTSNHSTAPCNHPPQPKQRHISPSSFINTNLNSNPQILYDDVVGLAALAAGVAPEITPTADLNKEDKNNNLISKQTTLVAPESGNATENTDPTKSILNSHWMDLLLSEIQCSANETDAIAQTNVTKNPKESAKSPELNLPASQSSSQDPNRNLFSLIDLLEEETNLSTPSKQNSPTNSGKRQNLMCYETMDIITTPKATRNHCVTPPNTSFTSPCSNPALPVSMCSPHLCSQLWGNSVSNANPFYNSPSIFHNPPEPVLLKKKEEKGPKAPKRLPSKKRKKETKLATTSQTIKAHDSYLTIGDSSLVKLGIKTRRCKMSTLFPLPKSTKPVVVYHILATLNIRFFNVEPIVTPVEVKHSNPIRINSIPKTMPKPVRRKRKSKSPLWSKVSSRNKSSPTVNGEFLSEISEKSAERAVDAIVPQTSSHSPQPNDTLDCVNKTTKTTKTNIPNQIIPKPLKQSELLAKPTFGALLATPSLVTTSKFSSNMSEDTMKFSDDPNSPPDKAAKSTAISTSKTHQKVYENLTNSTISSPMSELSSEINISRNFSVFETETGTIMKRRKMFHGRPLIVKRGTEPIHIHLCDQTSCVDPRNNAIDIPNAFLKVKWLMEEYSIKADEKKTIHCSSSNKVDNEAIQYEDQQEIAQLNKVSEFRVKLLLNRPCDEYEPGETEHQHMDSSEDMVGDDANDEDIIPFGSSPRDFFPNSSDSENDRLI